MSARNFLERHGMLAALIDPEKELDRFLEEMERVQQGGEGSLKMIPAFLGEYRPPVRPQKITVMDIGGTNVRTGIVELGPEGMIRAVPMAPFLTPGLEEEMNAEAFFRRIALGVSGQSTWEKVTAPEGSPLGICFSFALKPAEGRDAEVAFGAKQIKVPDLVGQKIGSSFQKALESLGKPSGQRITVINDASAAALGGRSVRTEKKYSGYLGFIYGTGTNTSYCTKDGAIVNVESGAYCSFPAGDIDDVYDRSLIDAGQDRFEKMATGGYLKGLSDCTLYFAAQEGEISHHTYEKLHRNGAAALEPKEISAFTGDPDRDGCIAGACASRGDRDFLLELFDELTGRSARLCSITITAAMIKAGAGRGCEGPAFITAEGSAFTGQSGFSKKLYAEMDALAGQKYGLQYEFHTVGQVTFRGTAVACLSEGKTDYGFLPDIEYNS